MLKALNSFSEGGTQTTMITTPYLHQHSAEFNTMILSDFHSSLPLKEYITSHKLGAIEVLGLGTALGQWSRSFHEWSSAPEQSSLRETMRGSTQIADMKHEITYGRLKEAISMFPAILEGSRELFAQLEQQLRSDLQEAQSHLIHGDFKCAK